MYDELAVLEVTATLAVVVDGLAEDVIGFVLAVEAIQKQRRVLHHHNVHQHRHEPLGVGGAAGDVHDRLASTPHFLQVLLHAHSACGRLGCAAASSRRSRRRSPGPQRHWRSRRPRPGRCVPGLSATRRALPSHALQHGALVHQDVVARRRWSAPWPPPWNGRQLQTGSPSSSGRSDSRTMPAGSGRLHLGERLRAARARSALDPDDG